MFYEKNNNYRYIFLKRSPYAEFTHVLFIELYNCHNITLRKAMNTDIELVRNKTFSKNFVYVWYQLRQTKYCM